MNRTDVDILVNWIRHNEKKEFSCIDKEAPTYFEDSTLRDIYITQYSFNSASELQDLFCDYAPNLDKRLIGICSVEAYKNKPVKDGVDAVITSSEIPDFVYAL